MKEKNIINFRGHELFNKEVEALWDLEKLIKKELPLREKVSMFGSFGFCVKNSSVSALSLYKNKLPYLPSSIGNFPNLQRLYLSETGIEKSTRCYRKLVCSQVPRYFI